MVLLSLSFSQVRTIQPCQSEWHEAPSSVVRILTTLQNPIALVEALLWFMFGLDEALGFDPNVRRVPPAPERPNGPPSYVYRLFGEDHGQTWERYYRTTKPLYNRRGKRIIGRATRVWEAHRVVSFTDDTRMDNKTVVLREAWIDVGAQTERQIQNSVFSDLGSFGQKLADDPKYEPVHFSMWDDKLKAEIRALFASRNSDRDETGGSKKTYKDYFLTILCDCLGGPCKEVAPGSHVRNDVLREVADLPSGKGKCTSTAGVGDPFSCSPKRPYRLIYEECCQDLDDDSLRSLQDVFTALRDCFMGEHITFSFNTNRS